METGAATELEQHRPRRPLGVHVLVASLLVLSLTALYGGAALVAAPDASLVDAVIPVDLTHLEGTPFADYTVPGLILFVALGLVPLVVVYGLWTRTAWAWPGAVGSGVLLLGWLVVEVWLVGYVSVLQPAYALFGLGILGLAFLPSVRAHLPGAEAT